jgi:predicted kinase
MVRTKVACIREVQELRSGEPVAAEVDELRRHLELAQAYLDRPTPRLLITCGLSGSGKSTVAGQLLGPLGAIRIRSDVERKRLAGIGPEEKSGNAGIDAGLYAPAMTERTYRRLLELADSTLANGWSVIVDAAFLRRSERDQFQELARRRAIPFTILYCKAPLAVLRERVLRRADTGGDVSEATADVLQHQTLWISSPGWRLWYPGRA